MKRRFSPFWIIATVLACLVIAALFYRPFGGALRSATGTVTSWMFYPFALIGRGFSNAGSSAVNWVGAIREVERLSAVEERLVVLTAENERLAETAVTLEKALGIREAFGEKTAIGEIFGGFSEGRDEFLLIRESSGSVGEGAVALSSNGTLVGIVRSASGGHATVRLAASPSETFTVAVGPNRVNGVMRGDNNGEYLIDLISKDAAVSPGDVVSVAGRTFGVPPGTPVGIVVEVRRSPTESFLEIRAKAPFDVRLLSQLVIVLQ